MVSDVHRSSPEPVLERWFGFAFICGLHWLLLGALAVASFRPEVAQDLLRVDVRMIEETPPPKVEPVKPRPLPAVSHRVSAPELKPAPPAPPAPVMTAVAEAPATYAVPPQPTAPAKPDPAPVAAPTPPVSKARFDAEYLQNPAPAYPRASRRAGDEGRVLLRVLVTAQGTASAVQVQASSGHPRLDEAALETVRQWRFVPAKRGADPMEDWVLVPIVFRLDR